MAQVQAEVRHHVGLQLRHRFANPRHGLDDVGAGLALGAHAEGWFAVVANIRDGFLVAELDLGDVFHGDPREAARYGVFDAAQHDGANPLDGIEFGFGAHHIAPLALVDVAGRDRQVGDAHGGDHSRHGEAEAGHALGVDGDAQLALGATVDVDPGDARHALETVLQDVGREVAEGVHLARVAIEPGQHEPGDRLVLGAGGAERRLIHLVGVAGHPVEPVGHQQQGAVHVLADLELEGQARPSVLGTALDLGHALETLEHLFLAVDDLAFDFGRRPAQPVGGDGNDRPADIGRELNRDGLERQQAEHHRHQHRRDHGDRTLDGCLDQVHLRVSVETHGLARHEAFVAAHHHHVARD